MPSRFAEELRKLRHHQKLSQSAMAYKLHVDPSRISRWERDKLPPLNMVERISATFGVNAHEWLHDSQKAPSADALANEPRVVHMKPEPPRNEVEDSNWRSKAIELLSRMTDLLESLIKNARGGGGVSKLISGRDTGQGDLSGQGPQAVPASPLLNSALLNTWALYLRPQR